MSYVEKQYIWYHRQKSYQINGWIGAHAWITTCFSSWISPPSHKLHTCALLSGILPYKPVSLQPMSSNPEPSYIPHDTFAQNHFQILWQDKWCTCIRNRSLRQSKPIVISHRLFKQEQGSWPCASLQTAWCLNLKSMRKLEIFSFLQCNNSLLYTVPFCKSPKAVQQLEAPEFPRDISACNTSRKVLFF